MTPALAAALVSAQADMPALQRDKLNPHFKSRYLSLESLLEEVLPVLNSHGLALVQLPSFGLGQDGSTYPALQTMIIHGESGESIETTMLLLAVKSDPQGQGSAITYARRYSLMSMLGLSADEDDDGNAASSAKANATRKGASQRVPEGESDGQRSATPPGSISAAQLKRLHTLVGVHGLSAHTAKALIRRVAGVESSKDIPAEKYDAVCAEIQRVPK